MLEELIALRNDIHAFRNQLHAMEADWRHVPKKNKKAILLKYCGVGKIRALRSFFYHNTGMPFERIKNLSLTPGPSPGGGRGELVFNEKKSSVKETFPPRERGSG